MTLFEDTNPRAPSDYLAEILNMDGFPLETLLASHGLPVVEDSPLVYGDYDAFLALRQERLWQETLRVTGATVSGRGS